MKMIKLFITAVIGFVLIIILMNWASTVPDVKSPPQPEPKPLPPSAVKWSVMNPYVTVENGFLIVSNGDLLQQWPQLTVALNDPQFGYTVQMPPLKPENWVKYRFEQFTNSAGYSFDPTVQPVNCVLIGGGKYHWQWVKFIGTTEP